MNILIPKNVAVIISQEPKIAGFTLWAIISTAIRPPNPATETNTQPQAGKRVNIPSRITSMIACENVMVITSLNSFYQYSLHYSKL